MKDLSRRMPALLMRMSTLPKASSAVLTMAWAPSAVSTPWGSATASPPPALISATPLLAISRLPAPDPSTVPPRSLITSLAPREASSMAWERPRPPPAPVMMATLPSNRPSAMFASLRDYGEMIPLPTGGLTRPHSPGHITHLIGQAQGLSELRRRQPHSLQSLR